MFPTKNWVERYVELLNRDEELKLYGKYYHLDYALASDSGQYVISAKDGSFRLNNEQDTLPQLTFRTTSEHWRNFASPQVVPTYTDLFGASAHGNLEIEGDIKNIWSNIRVLWRSVELMRKVGEAL